jgi:hypothetical protein
MQTQKQILSLRTPISQGNDATSVGNWFPTFLMNMVKRSEKKMRALCFFEMSETNYTVMQKNKSPQPHHCENLKTRKFCHHLTQKMVAYHILKFLFQIELVKVT